jgi:hypothetical protein
MTSPLYIIMQDFGGRLGHEAIVHPGDTFESVVDDIFDAQWNGDRIVYIREIRADGTWSDIAGKVAQRVHDRLQSEGQGCPPCLADFLDTFVARDASARLDRDAQINMRETA